MAAALALVLGGGGAGGAGLKLVVEVREDSIAAQRFLGQQINRANTAGRMSCEEAARINAACFFRGPAP